MAEGIVARYLGKHCPTTWQLAAFVSRQMLPADVLSRIIGGINKDVEAGGKEVDVTKGEDFEKVKGAIARKEMTKIYNVGAVDDEDVQQEAVAEEDAQKEKGVQDQKDIIKRFLEFTNFPEELRNKMVEAFFDQAV